MTKQRNHWWRERVDRIDPSSIESSKLADKVILIAGSAGAIPVLMDLLQPLPATFPFPIVICQHRGLSLPNLLAEILQRQTKLRVRLAEAGDVIEAGTVLVAPPHGHLMIDENCCLEIIDGRRIHYLGSAAEPLFFSAARIFGPRVVAIVLTGFGGDAAMGVQEVKKHGGTVIVQDQATSQIFGMPDAAIKTGCVDKILSVDEIGAELLKLGEIRVSEGA